MDASALLLLLAAFIFSAVNSQTNNHCLVSFNASTMRASDPRLIAGYNDVLGPIINLTYNDSSLLLSAEKLYPGILRHPGGTVANYWNFSNASYVSPCSTANYNYCSWQARIDQLPLQTFAPGKFYRGVGSSSPLTVNEAHSIVYDLNILTLNGNELLQQLDVLNTQISADKIHYLELGNEYYIAKNYEWEFPNATVYMKKAMPLIQAARTKNPDAKIAMVSQRALPGQNKPWNDQLAAFKSDVDSVTIHDYSCYDGSGSAADQESFVAVYGISVIPQYIDYVHGKFGKEKTIWMTEYNWALNGKYNESQSYSVLHAMFSLSYITAAICDASRTMELLMLHEYSEQDGTNWGTLNSASFNPAMANNDAGARFDVVGQILAQISYVSMMRNDQMYCLNVEDTKQSNQQCPTLDIEVVNRKNLKCLYGAGFNNQQNANSFALFVVNACHESIEVDLDLSSITKLTHEVTLNYHEYRYDVDGGNTAQFVKCTQNVWNAECAAVAPTYKQMNVSSAQNSVSLSVSALSVVIANTP